MRRGYLKRVPSALSCLNALPVLMLATGFFWSRSLDVFHYFGAAKASQDGPQDGPKLDLVLGGFWASQTRPRWPKLALRWPQDELKTAPRRVNLAPQDEHKLGPILERSLGFQNEPKMAQVDPKMDTRRPARHDRSAQDVSRYAQNAFSPRCLKI